MADGMRRAEVDLQAFQRFVGGNLIWVGLAFLLLMMVIVSSVRVGRVTGEEVGVLLDKITGKMTVIEQRGVKIYFGLIQSFHVLDTRMTILEMTEREGRGDRVVKDDLKIKTNDGSDVYVDLKVQYKIMPEKADVILQTSGVGEIYKEKWVRDYTRSLCRNALGELTTEEFYDAAKRQTKVRDATAEANTRLNPFGIRIDSIGIPQKPHFYEEYEEMIKQKKLADQAVREEESKALAAEQRKATSLVQETNIKNVAIEEFEGEMEQKTIEATAAGEKARKKADAEYERLTVGAEAELYQKRKMADGILAKKKAEAEGIEALKQALEGEGGRNMVKLEYARKLKGVTITGQPFVRQGATYRFEHMKGAAAQGK
ncbi:MAG: hypothetical protein HN742_14280 [Lentisphaerae bacterium]|jgi:regulator of protease activity HflC (stomatin/prohibitin superfamily)|nr:hypothetical protein [Lentisphaerota bacterium]MBT5606636.1 hypothetical protein [Lentisphaerota bacterium]MBT7059521.1 hypothetical protein [Lentisphaerota bacterium]MBT7843042.1 hypothetical protein [Lentisphaerota bacterium]